jgi:AraC-like DNA-binding protein
MPKKSTDSQGERIVKLRDVDGKTWAEISEIIGERPNKCMWLYEEAAVTPKTRITAKTEDELRQKIADARANGVSWGKIAARSGKSEGYCKKAFEDLTGEAARGHRIGKGGRFPAEMAVGARKAVGATKKAAAKKASKTVKKAAAKAPAKKATKKQVAKKAKKAA